MKQSFGLGTIQVLFKDLPKVAKFYIDQLKGTEDNSFLNSLGGPVYRVMRASEFEEIAFEQNYMFDIFKEHPASSDHYEAAVFNNNSGGPTWVIPKDFVSAATKVLIEGNL
jgi:hypothetical protein